MGPLAVHTPKHGMVAWAASHVAGSSRAGVPPSGVGKGPPPATGRAGTSSTMVFKALAQGTLSVGVEM